MMSARSKVMPRTKPMPAGPSALALAFALALGSLAWGARGAAHPRLQSAAGPILPVGQIGGMLGPLAVPLDHDGRSVWVGVGARVVRYEADEAGTLHATWRSEPAVGRITALASDGEHLVAAAGEFTAEAFVLAWRIGPGVEPRRIGQRSVPEHVNDISLADGIAWLAGTSHVRAIDPVTLEPLPMDHPAVEVLEGRGGYVNQVQVVGEQVWAMAGPRIALILRPEDDPREISLGVLHGGPIGAASLPRLLELPGFASHLAIVGDTAWVAGKHTGLLSLSLTDPERPAIVARHRLPGGEQDPTIVGDLALHGDQVLLAADGLRVFDGSDPTAPRLLSHLPGPTGSGIAAADDVAWLTDGQGALRRVDLEDPAAPRETAMSTLAPHAPWRVAILDDVLWVVDRADPFTRDDVLRAIDISEPGEARLLPHQLEGLNDVRALLAAGGRLVAIEAGGDLVLIDPPDGDGDTPRVVLRRSVASGGTAPFQGVADASENRVVLGTPTGLMVVEDVQGEPRFYPNTRINGPAQAIALLGDQAWVLTTPNIAGAPNDLVVLDLSRPGLPPLLRQTAFARMAAIDAAGSIVAIGTVDAGLILVDGRRTDTVRELGKLDVEGWPMAVHIDGGEVWLAIRQMTADQSQSFEQLWRIDIGLPEQPNEAGRSALLGSVDDLVLSRGLVAAARGRAGLFLYGERRPAPTATASPSPTATALPTPTVPSPSRVLALPWVRPGR